MTYSVEVVRDGYRLVLADEPSNCVSLQMGPNQLEEQVAIGSWLLLYFAVWSAPDLRAVEEALAVARTRPDIQVGVRPFDEYEEVWRLHAFLVNRRATPAWIVMNDGVVTWERSGALQREELLRALGPKL